MADTQHPAEKDILGLRRLRPLRRLQRPGVGIPSDGDRHVDNPLVGPLPAEAPTRHLRSYHPGVVLLGAGGVLDGQLFCRHGDQQDRRVAAKPHAQPVVQRRPNALTDVCNQILPLSDQENLLHVGPTLRTGAYWLLVEIIVFYAIQLATMHLGGPLLGYTSKKTAAGMAKGSSCGGGCGTGWFRKMVSAG
eukprot:CAMPEP_0170191884 /NCGR_PEP_ID=MMETSP0040_2-20121228/52831_1 /TAXON_ID=641309 /ORGANISM="Lotharella oceanica, Strain CCMP622" /LENGTH=190 /DNA_ID=CAMNT_0010440085 /DNA_START=86 /DNA_END=659 /DNA_ORIENTATION=+